MPLKALGLVMAIFLPFQTDPGFLIHHLNGCRLKNIINQKLFRHIENFMFGPNGYPDDNARL
jgi:hypothetical protein